MTPIPLVLLALAAILVSLLITSVLCAVAIRHKDKPSWTFALFGWIGGLPLHYALRHPHSVPEWVGAFTMGIILFTFMSTLVAVDLFRQRKSE
jgi:hypothetical protein